MRDDYTVKELASICNVTEQAIRYYLAQNDCAKVASKWKPTKDELKELFRHYGVDIAELAQESQSVCANDTKNTNAFAQETQNEETAGQTAILQEKVNQLEIRLKEKDSEIDFLRNELKDSREVQKQLAVQNTVFTTKYLVEASQEQESETVIDVQSKEQSINENAEEVEQNNAKEIEEQTPQKEYTFGQRLSFLFTGRLE